MCVKQIDIRGKRPTKNGRLAGNFDWLHDLSALWLVFDMVFNFFLIAGVDLAI